MHPFHGHERKTYGAQFISIRPFCCHIAFYILCHSQKAPVDLAARHKLRVLYYEQPRARRLHRLNDPDDLVRRTYARKDGREQKAFSSSPGHCRWAFHFTRSSRWGICSTSAGSGRPPKRTSSGSPCSSPSFRRSCRVRSDATQDSPTSSTRNTASIWAVLSAASSASSGAFSRRWSSRTTRFIL